MWEIFCSEKRKVTEVPTTHTSKSCNFTKGGLPQRHHQSYKHTILQVF